MNSSADPLFASVATPSDDEFIVDPLTDEPMQDSDQFFSQAYSTATGGSDLLISSPNFPTASLSDGKDQAETMEGVGGDTAASSPERSSEDSSSSDDWRRHERKTSSIAFPTGTNHSGVPAEQKHPGSWKAPSPGSSGTAIFGQKAVPKQPSYSNDIDMSNKVMADHFDFDSAASSPSPLLMDAGATGETPRAVTNAHRTRPALRLQNPPSTVNDGRPLYATLSNGTNPLRKHMSPTLNLFSESTANMPARNASPYTSAPIHTTAAPAPAWLGGLTNVTAALLGTQAVPPRKSAWPTTKCQLIIHKIPSKSRVETQIPIKMTMFNFPAGVKKLHLPTHTIWKPKLLSRPTPEKSPDSLELSSMLVCMSAMQDPLKRVKALRRAAMQAQRPCQKTSARPVSGDANANDDEDSPQNGGEVFICDGCITREQKRAARKKSKKPEEDEAWKQDEHLRVVVFNTTEIKEWQEAAPDPDIPASALNGRGRKLDSSFDGAMQVEMPMRIACYCRHQNEKAGFQVIFTIKDHKDNLVAQQISDPIVITDDHKAQPPTPMTLGDGMHGILASPTDDFFSSGTLNFGAGLARNAHSATDLAGLQRAFNVNMTNRPSYPFATVSQSSHQTSVSVTPNNRSRQVSPVAHGAPSAKRRKASVAAKLAPHQLEMTQLQSSLESSMPFQARGIAARSHNPASAATSPFNGHFPQQPFTITQPQQAPHPGPSGPPTPDSATNAFYNQITHSQSFDSVMSVQQAFSAPPSRGPSRVPSPTSLGMTQNHAVNGHQRNLTGTFMPQQHMQTTPRPPVINEIIPDYGPKAGGKKVTILGSGFYQGIEVMFGGSRATTTTYWGETTLVCLTPPSDRAGSVSVTFKPQFQQMMQGLRMPHQQQYYRYVDEEEQEIIKHAMLVMYNKTMGGQTNDAGEAARNIMSGQSSNGGGWSGGYGQHTGHQHRTAVLQASFLSGSDVEDVLMRCLETIDLDDSPFPAHFDLAQSNGQSLLHLAVSLGYQRFSAALLARGASPNLHDVNGLTPLHVAALRGRAVIARKLRLQGAHPMIRTLLGHTPADLAKDLEVLHCVEGPTHSRSLSMGAGRDMSRNSSSTSFTEMSRVLPAAASLQADFDDWGADTSSEDDEDQAVSRHEASMLQLEWQASRRDSLAIKEAMNTTLPSAVAANIINVAPAAAIAAWRDHLAAQIQHFQQSVNGMLPHLQIPTLPNMPPLPTLPDYQMPMRRISSLVPQRASSPSSGSGHDSGDLTPSRDGESKWWDFLTGSQSQAPPSYEEIYPDQTDHDLDTKATAVAGALGSTFKQRTATQPTSQSTVSTITTPTEGGSKTRFVPMSIGKGGLTPERQKELRAAHAQRLKKLRSDRNLFFVWIPLLVLVLMLVLWDKVPGAWSLTKDAYVFVRSYAIQEFV